MTLTGRCLCGGIAFETEADPAKILACHCEDCRRQATGPMQTACLPRQAVRWSDPEGLLRTYEAAPGNRRGFCGRCGSALYWEALHEAERYVSVGAMDAPTGQRLTKHIFTSSKGDWYDLPADGLPRS